MTINVPKPGVRRKPVAIPPSDDVRNNLQSMDPNGSFKFSWRVPMEKAAEVKMEAARRMISLQELFEHSFEAYKEKHRER